MNEKYKIMREKKPSSFPLMSHNIIVLITTENFKTIIEEDFYFGNKEITNDKTLRNECTCGMCLINYHMCASYLILYYTNWKPCLVKFAYLSWCKAIVAKSSFKFNISLSY
jgi:hypothetical protein